MKKAKITPVRKKRPPKYPDLYSTQLNHLLLANRPLRWKAAPVAGTVLSAVVMLGLAGCSDPYKDTATMGPPMPMSDPPPAAGLKTPLFEHGIGVGVFGCVSVAAPIYLSEDDAFAVIKDEFERMNLTVVQGGCMVENIQIPKINPYFSLDGEENKIQTQNGSFEFDFAVMESPVVMEYVSINDMRMWESVEPDENGETWVSSILSYNYKEAAQVLNTSLNETSSETVHGVFYDPAEWADLDGIPEDDDWEETFSKLAGEARQRAADILREQVKDFLEWLSAQGVI
jgi:hypothetical protein